MFNFAPMLIGAGIGALGGLLTGKDPLKGAAVGGATGGLFGNIPAGSWMGGGAEVAKTATPSMGIKLVDTASGLPQAVGAGGMFAENSLPYASQALGASGVGGISDLGMYATGTGTDIMAASPSILDQIKPYANVQNLSGASSIMNQYSQRKPLPTAPSGGVSRGQAPQGTDVMALLASVKPREQRRISLL